MTPIRTATDTVLPPIRVGIDPQDIAITPDGKTGYVANETSGTVNPIRIATDTALPPIKTSNIPGAIAITTTRGPSPMHGCCRVQVQSGLVRGFAAAGAAARGVAQLPVGRGKH
ncbi:MAG TPA: hypothetical protein VGS19_13500 [Streptosporangiaceae bacterium]|nr:hypothetical protein [Streptosporangiaceae bacterium]